MGNGALKRIDAGVGDPYERTTVNTGRIIGIVTTILMCVFTLFQLTMVVVFGVLGSHSTSSSP